MSGVAYMHSDLGGFTGGGQNPEMYTRWFQLGAFSPIMRTHGHQVPPEPYNYPAFNRNICLEYAKLRYSLLPYNYQLAYYNSTFGLPLALPTDFFEPNNSFLQELDEQFLWGPDILVAPVLDENTNTKSVRLPSGKWVDYHTHLVYNGLSQIQVNAPINRLPLFVRSGSLLPMAPEMKTTAHYQYDTLIIRHYFDDQNPQNELSLFTDNGTTPKSIENQEFAYLNFETSAMANAYKISCSHTGLGYSGMPTQRLYQFQIVRYMTAPGKVEWNNIALTTYNSITQLQAAGTGYFYDNSAKILHAQVPYPNNNSELIITEGQVSISELAATLNLGNPYPNPASTQVRWELIFEEAGMYAVEVINGLGQVVFKEDLGYRGPGSELYDWNLISNTGSKVLPGLYLIRFTQPSGQSVRKLILE